MDGFWFHFSEMERLGKVLEEDQGTVLDVLSLRYS